MASAQQVPASSRQPRDATDDLYYSRRAGVATNKGTEYEYKMSALLFLRALNLRVEFQLGTNVATAGAFDDIVLRYESGGQEVLVAIQLKHKVRDDFEVFRPTLASFKGDFALNKYFRSFCDEMQDLDKPPGRTYFVLYTNVKVKVKDKMQAPNVPAELRSMLNTGGASSCMSHFNLVDDSDVCGHLIEDPKASEFLNQFIVFSDQANEYQLDGLIKQEIIKHCNLIIPEVNTIFRSLETEVRNWWQTSTSENNSYYLTNRWSAWNKITKLSKLQTSLISRLTFLGSEIVALACKIFDSDCTVLHVVYSDGTDVGLRSLKMLQALRSRSDRRFLMVSATETEECLSAVLDLWAGGWCDVMVVDVANTIGIQKCHQLGDQINNIRKMSDTKRLAIISGKSQCHLSQCIKDNKIGVWEDYTDNCEFKQLDQESQECILNLKVSFQGTGVKWRSTDQNEVLGEVLKGKIFCDFLNYKKGHTVGKPLTLNDEIYIPRKLERHILIQKEILASPEIQDAIVITGTTREELLKLLHQEESVQVNDGSGCKGVQHIVANVNEASYMCRKIFDDKKIPVHLLHKEGEYLFWKESWGERHNLCLFVQAKATEVEDVRRLVAESKSCTVGVEQVLRSNMRTVLVTGEPGMGKSELLTHVAGEAKTLRPDSWVLRVNLSDITADLHDMETDSATPELVCGLLKTSAGVSNSSFPELAAALLQDAVERTGNLIVLFDAIDEVAPNYTTKVFNILKTLLRTKLSSLWLTSRYVMYYDLENEFETQTFRLVSFSDQERTDFIVKLWRKRSLILPEELYSRAREFLRDVSRVLTAGNGRVISGTPLLMRMLVDIYPADEYNISTTLNLVDIYDKFIDRSFEVFFSETMRLDTAIPGMEDVINPFRTRLIKRYQMCSMRILGLTDGLSKTEKLKIERKTSLFLEEVKSGKERVGIIHSIKQDNAHFEHHTFAEYFVAQWLTEHKDDNLSIIRLIFSKEIYLFVRDVFNRILCRESPLHSAVLDNNTVEVEAALSSQDVDTVDGLGRTALHLAANSWRENTISIVQLLLDHSANTEVKDTILQRTPIYHAAVIEAWDTVKLLLRRGAKVENNVAKGKMVQNVLKLAVSKGYCEDDPRLYKYFDVNWKIFDRANEVNRDTILHLAVRCKQVDCVEHLLKKGAHTDVCNNATLTPLNEGVCGCKEDIVRILLNYTPNIHSKCMWYQNPLYYACLSRGIHIVRMLLNKGADPNIHPVYGIPALHAACGTSITVTSTVQGPYTDTMPSKIVLTYTPTEIQSTQAAVPVNFKIVQLLLQKKADVNIKDMFGYTPLFVAVQRNSEDLLRLLLKYKADVNIRNVFNRTPIHMAYYFGHQNIVNILLEEKAKTEVYDIFGRSVLHAATLGGHRAVMEMLIVDSGVNVEAKDVFGRTPLHYAAASNIPDTLDMLKLLVEHNADMKATDIAGCTPLHVACATGNMEGIQYIVATGTNELLAIENMRGLTAIGIARERQDGENIVDYLEKENQKTLNNRELQSIDRVFVQ